MTSICIAIGTILYFLIAIPLAMAIGKYFRNIQKYYPEVEEANRRMGLK